MPKRHDSIEQILQQLFAPTSEDGPEPLMAGTRGACRFDIEGEGSWLMASYDGFIQLRRSQPEQSADCELRCSRDTLEGLLSGRRNLITAAMQGLIEIQGDLSLTNRIYNLSRVRREGAGPAQSRQAA